MDSKPIFRIRRNLTFKDREFSHKKKDDIYHPFSTKLKHTRTIF